MAIYNKTFNGINHTFTINKDVCRDEFIDPNEGLLRIYELNDVLRVKKNKRIYAKFETWLFSPNGGIMNFEVSNYIEVSTPQEYDALWALSTQLQKGDAEDRMLINGLFADVLKKFHRGLSIRVFDFNNGLAQYDSIDFSVENVSHETDVLNNGSFDVNVVQGDGNYEYAISLDRGETWEDFQSSNSFSNLSPQLYLVKARTTTENKNNKESDYILEVVINAYSA